MEFSLVRALQEWKGNVNKTNNDGALNDTWICACGTKAALSIELRVTIPLHVIGIVINCVVIYVWNGETTFQPTTYLFKAMAVADNLARLLSFVLLRNVKLDTKNKMLHDFIDDIYEGFIRAMYCIIMLVALVRYMTISCEGPTCCLLLSRHGMRLAVGLVFSAYITISVLISFTRAALDNMVSENVNATALWLAMLPILAQVVLMILILCKISRPLNCLTMIIAKTLCLAAVLRSLCRCLTSQTTPRHDSPKNTDGPGTMHEVPAARQPPSNRIASRKLEYTVLVICLNSLVIGPVLGITLGITLNDSVSCVSYAWVDALFLMARSWNIVFYVLFLHKFRQLFIKRCPRLAVCFYAKSSDFHETVLSSSGTSAQFKIKECGHLSDVSEQEPPDSPGNALVKAGFTKPNDLYETVLSTSNYNFPKLKNRVHPTDVTESCTTQSVASD
jgi:hypothetical protein